MKQYRATPEPFYDPREDDFAAELAALPSDDFLPRLTQLPAFVDPQVVKRPLTLDEIRSNLLRSRYMILAQGFRELPRPYANGVGSRSVVRDKAMVRTKQLALAMLEQEVLQFEDDERPDYCDGPDVHAAWRTKVRTQMARRIKKLLHRVPVRRRVTERDDEGNPVSVVKQFGMRTALKELRALRNHPAFVRQQACAEHWTYRNRTCTCPTPAQLKLRKHIGLLTKQDQPWLLLFVYLTYQGYVQHYYDFFLPVEGSKDAHPNGDRRVWQGDRRPDELVTRWHTEVDDDGVEHDVADETESVTVVDGGKTGWLNAFDLCGWDRPSFRPTKAHRLAYCPVCAMEGEPWFLVKRTKRDPEPLGTCPTCQTEESPPQPAAAVQRKPITYTARKRPMVNGRPVTRNGVPVVHEEVFERRRGRWFYTSTNEQCSAILNGMIEQRWAATKKRPAPKPAVAPPAKDTSEALALCRNAAAVTDVSQYDEAVLRKLLTKLDTAIDQLTELPVGTMKVRSLLVQRLRVLDQRVPVQTGKLLAPRTEVIKEWVVSSARQLEVPERVVEAPAVEVLPAEVPPPKQVEGTFKLRLEDGCLVTTEEPCIVIYELPSYDKDALYYGDELSDPIMTGREYLLDLLAKYDAL